MTAWAGRTPRAWQVEALAAVHAQRGSRSVIRAATGAGKSILQAEIVADALAEGLDGVIVVTVPTQALTEQLAATIQDRVGGLWAVTRYYQHSREVGDVVVVCHASLTQGDAVWGCAACTPAPQGARAVDARDVRKVWIEQAVAWMGREGAPCPCADLEGHRGAGVWRASPGGLAAALAGRKVALWLADECHKTECAQVKAWASWVEPERAVGFTATPWRGLERERLTLWDSVAYDYGPQAAIRDGVILAPKIVSYEGERTERDEACAQMIAAHLAAHKGPGVVSADSIADARAFAQRLERDGVRAAPISCADARPDRVRLLEELRTGELDALVHVNLLAEGVDLPWLEWLCLRRGAGSRVRLAQEVGRVVRSAPGKEGCWVLDPCDAFGSLSLDYEAALGWVEPEPSPLVEAPQDEAGESEGQAPARDRWVETASCVRWLREVVLGARFAGWCELKVKSTSWRRLAATPRQLDLVERLGRDARVKRTAQDLHPVDALALRSCYRAALVGELDRGSVSDLVDVLTIAAERCKVRE